MPPERVFLVPSGYNFRAVLAFCRALRRAGHTTAVVACTDQDPIFRTSFSQDVVFTRSRRQLELADFAAAAQIAQARAGAKRCVLAPTSEFLVRWGLRHRAALAAIGCDLPLPDESVYLRVTEKESFTAFCRGRGLPVPAELSGPHRLPCVAKPRWNVAPDGRSLYPWLLRTPADVARFIAETNADHFFFQEWVEGRSYYLLFHLPVDGTPVVFSQENLAQQPEGKSILLARAGELHLTGEADRWRDALRAAGFFGLVMIELRQRGDDYVLIEANPRLWGPLQLCVDACPALVMGYLAEYTGRANRAGAAQPSRRRSYYAWTGGGKVTGEIAWHGRKPLFQRLALCLRCGVDVYLRRDSWRHFFFEHFGRFATPRPAPLPTSLAKPELTAIT